MNVYVESNFLVELTLSQQEHKSCEEIVELCVSGHHSLVVPAFCIPKSFHALEGKATKRLKRLVDFQNEIRELSRSSHYSERLAEVGIIYFTNPSR